MALLLSSQGRYRFAAAILAETDCRAVSIAAKRRIARALDHGGQHELAVSLFAELVATPETEAAIYTDEMRSHDTSRLGLAELYLAANEHIARISIPQTDLMGIVVIYNVANAVLAGLMVPLLRPLMQDGCRLVTVVEGTLATPATGMRDVDRLQGCVAPSGRWFVGRGGPQLAHDWTVDWAAGVVETGGINYFPYFHERVAQKARRYKADIAGDSESAKRFGVLLEQADVALTICEKLLDVAAKHRKPIRIAFMDSHFAPQGIIREWCHQVGRNHDIHAVVLSVGYENYFSNLTSLEATTLAVEDITAQPELRQPFLGGPHRLQSFLAANPHLDLDSDPDHQLMSWICQDRSKVGGSPEGRAQVSRMVDEVRSSGGKVFVALGKVSVDFAAPGDRGHAHEDFVTWINHLVEGVAGTDNLLLIKPHPHELREEIFVQGVQMLRELVVPVLPDNVVFLEHDAYNTHELADLVDAAFLWNGTAALEFSILGVPVAPASIWADRDYPVGLQILRTREEYEEVLQGKKELVLSEGVERRAALHLRLMRSDQVAIPYPYVRRAATNLTVGAPVLHPERMRDLEEAFDPFVLRAASRFFEFS